MPPEVTRPERHDAAQADERTIRPGAADSHSLGPAVLMVSAWLILGSVVLVRFARATHAAPGTPYTIPLALGLDGAGLIWLGLGLLLCLGLTALWWWDRRQDHFAPAESHAAPARRWVLAAAMVAAVTLVAFLSLFRPIPAHQICRSAVIHLNAHMGFVFNCDSFLYQFLAAHPSHLLDPGQPRQSRPLYVLLGAGLYQTVGRVAGWLGITRFPVGNGPSYVSLIVINLAILALTGYLFARRILRMGSGYAITAALLAVLLFNTLTAEWTLTPHQQLFAMAVPVVTVLLAERALTDPPTWRVAGLWGLGLGLALLIYGSWPVTLAVLSLIFAVKLRRRALAPIGALLGAAVAPNLGWIALCKAISGSYYNNEVNRYREFIWLLDTARQGPRAVGATSWSYALSTVREILGVRELWLVGIMLSLGVVMAVLTRTSLRPRRVEDRNLLYGIALTLAVSVPFLWAIGYYDIRLSISLLPPLLMLGGWIFSRLWATSRAGAAVVTAGLTIAAVAWVIAVITWPAPVLA